MDAIAAVDISIDRSTLAPYDQQRTVHIAKGIEFCYLWETTAFDKEFMHLIYERFCPCLDIQDK
jgi:hypothetical protein